MKNKLITGMKITLALFLLAACNSNNVPEEKSMQGKGGKIYGGTFRLNFTEQFESLNTLQMADIYSSSVGRQIHEGLLRIHPRSMKLTPGIAEHWEVDSSGTEYTFHLRRDVRFHDNACFPGGKGRILTANDVAYSYMRLCRQSADNLLFNMMFKNRLKGANQYFEASAGGNPSFSPEGVEVMDDFTIRLKLEEPFPNFPYLLALQGAFIVPREAIEKYGNHATVGAGPFVFTKEIEYPRNIILVRNPNYFRTDSLGNALPFLDSVVVSFLTTKEAELSEFMSKHLDMAYELPARSVKEIVESDIKAFQGKPPRFILERSSYLMTQYYNLMRKNPFLANKKVRQALNYAIDKDRIVKEILMGQAAGPAIYGFSPPDMEGYDITQFTGYPYNPDKARALLAEAGYPGGKNAPHLKLELNTGGARHANVAFEVAKQLQKELGIQLDLEVVPFPKKIEDEKFARADIFRSGWIADYPSPETFISIFYGKDVPEDYALPSYPNMNRYRNPAFDALYEKALVTADIAERNRLVAEAEKLLIEDAPIIPLWYEENYFLLQSNIRGFHSNPLRVMDLSQVYKKEPPQAAAKK